MNDIEFFSLLVDTYKENVFIKPCSYWVLLSEYLDKIRIASRYVNIKINQITFCIDTIDDMALLNITPDFKNIMFDTRVISDIEKRFVLKNIHLIKIQPTLFGKEFFIYTKDLLQARFES